MRPSVNRCNCGPVDQHHRCRLNLRTQTDADGIVYVLDFTGEAAARSVIRVHRKTTSSRRPGKTIEGSHTREAEERRFVLCECGCYRWSDDVPHAVRISSDATRRVDCMGRVVAQEVA